MKNRSVIMIDCVTMSLMKSEIYTGSEVLGITDEIKEFSG